MTLTQGGGTREVPGHVRVHRLVGLAEGTAPHQPRTWLGRPTSALVALDPTQGGGAVHVRPADAHAPGW